MLQTRPRPSCSTPLILLKTRPSWLAALPAAQLATTHPLIARKLATTRRVVCGSSAYLKQRGAPKTPQQLREHNCLTYSYKPQPKIWTFKLGSEEEIVYVDGC